MPLVYCDSGGALLGGAGPDAAGVPVEKEDTFLVGSVKKSDGEKPSGLLCCDGESLRVDRAIDGAFLRTGRIHGGRVALAEPSRGRVSKGMLVTGC